MFGFGQDMVTASEVGGYGVNQKMYGNRLKPYRYLGETGGARRPGAPSSPGSPGTPISLLPGEQRLAELERRKAELLKKREKLKSAPPSGVFTFLTQLVGAGGEATTAAFRAKEAKHLSRAEELRQKAEILREQRFGLESQQKISERNVMLIGGGLAAILIVGGIVYLVGRDSPEKMIERRESKRAAQEAKLMEALQAIRGE